MNPSDIKEIVLDVIAVPPIIKYIKHNGRSAYKVEVSHHNKYEKLAEAYALWLKALKQEEKDRNECN